MKAAVHELDRERFRYKMKDLCRETGLERQAIHFYISEGLLPPGEKTGRNMAWYSDEHLERLHLIKKLQHERFLPLKAIRAVIDGREDTFPPAQQKFLEAMKVNLGPSLAPESGRRASIDATEAAEQSHEDQNLKQAGPLCPLWVAPLGPDIVYVCVHLPTPSYIPFWARRGLAPLQGWRTEAYEVKEPATQDSHSYGQFPTASWGPSEPL